ncbi:MAG: selenocysteine-specific translation elongation factor [Sulfitobacter sp.]
MKTCCVVVIGHVDHGKTALVHALTGIETDRLTEEKARGLSITAGFAHRSYAAGVVDFVDAPGHADYLQAMITGATGAQAVLIVISAVEGIAAQTIEHLNIAGLLGIKQGVIAVTKSDMLEPSGQAARLADIRRGLSRTPFAQAPLVVCSAHSGAGIDALHVAVETLLSRAPTAAAPSHSFLPIDRVFTLEGRGTVVTGTLLGKDLNLADAVTLHPSGRPIALRGLQSRGKSRNQIHTGERMAANLRGIAVTDIPRGSVLCAAGLVLPTTCIDVYLQMLADAPRPLKHMQELRVLFGTSSVVARLRLFGGGQLGPGLAGFAQLRFKVPVVGYAGQRAVLRQLSPATTCAGAVFLDPQATPTKASDRARSGVLKAARIGDAQGIATALSTAGQGVCAPKDIARLSGIPIDGVVPALGDSFTLLTADAISPQDQIDAGKTRILTALAAYHHAFPLRPYAPRNSVISPAIAPELTHHLETTMIAGGNIRCKDGQLAAFDHDPIAHLDTDQHKRMSEIEAALRQAALSPSGDVIHSTTDVDLLALLIDTGRVLALRNVALNQTLLFHAEALSAARTRLNTSFPAPRSFTTSEARTTLATSRRVIVPVLEHFDTTGLTVRTGNSRRMQTNVVSPPAAPR